MQMDSSSQLYAGDASEDASPRIIFELKNVQTDVSEIGEHVQRMEDQMTSMLQMMEHMCRLMISKDKRKHAPGNDTGTKFKYTKGSTEKEVTEYFNLAEALQENILLFLNDLSIRESFVLDRLVEKDCLSEDECDYIRSFNNTHDGIRTLITTIKRRDFKTIFDFLDIIGENSPHLKSKVYEKFNDKQNQGMREREQMCPTCLMTKIVNLKDVADILWQENLLPDNLYDIVIEDADRLRDILWNTILHRINKTKNSEQNIQILIKALEGRYGHVANLLKGHQSSGQRLTQLQCDCYRSALKRKRFAYANSSVASSVATTSVANIPRFLLLGTSSSLEETAEETEPRLEKLKENYDFSDTSKFEDEVEKPIPKVVSEDVLNKNVGVNVDIEELESRRKRHKSEPFDINKSKGIVSGEIQDPKVFNRTVSTCILVCEADSTTVEEDTQSIPRKDQPCNLSKDEGKASLRPEKLDFRYIGSRISADAESVEAQTTETEGMDNDSLDDLSSSRSRSELSLRREFYQRQMSAPVGLTITESKSVSNLGAKIGTRPYQSKKSKRSLKRKERRTRNADSEKSCPRKSPLVAEKSATGNIPYNPMWPKIPQSRDTLKWGYPEAKRFSLMANKMAEMTRRDNISKSDTETKYGETDTPDLSEYTI